MASSLATAASPGLSSAAFAAMPRTYANALHLLAQLPTNRDITILFEQDPAVDLNARALPEVRAWLARAGYADLERDLAGLRCVHVAGTKGKGSVCAFVTAILVAAGKTTGQPSAGRVGTYLSPHVVSVRERIWLDGRPIAPALFAQYTFELWERLSEAAKRAATNANAKTKTKVSEADPYAAATKPFYFRFLTLLALHVFVREGVRSAVVECGIGGEYDVTNVLPAACVTATGVSRLGIDHVAMLGRTPDQIAWHKAGIFKRGVAAFALDPSGQDDGRESQEPLQVLDVLHARATEKGTAGPLRVLSSAPINRWPGVPGAALPGPFQKYNMALAAALAQQHLRVLGGEGQSQKEEDSEVVSIPPEPWVCDAMATARLRGRCETVHDLSSSRPGLDLDWLVDGAHTADSLAEVARFFVQTDAQSVPETSSVSSVRRCRFLLFTVRDRDMASLLRTVLAETAITAPTTADGPFWEEVLLVLPPQDPAAAAEQRDSIQQTVAEVSPGSTSSFWPDAATAVAHVRAAAATTETASRCHVLATGSFSLAGDVLRLMDGDSADQ